MGRGVLHAAQGVGEGAVFLGRLAIPGLDNKAAWDQLGNAGMGAGRAAIDYGKKAVSDPGVVVRDAQSKVHEARTKLDPHATPEAPTFKGELRRRFDIGQNQGELLFDIGSLAVGGPLAKSVRGFPAAPVTAEKYIAQGFKPAVAAYLAEPYPSTGWGHHFPARSRRPSTSRDSDFNVLRPPGISRGDMYRLHYEVDRYFHGAGLPRKFGEHWSGKALGLKKHGAAGRLWYGSPAPLKARIGGSGAAAGGMAHDLSEEDDAW